MLNRRDCLIAGLTLSGTGFAAKSSNAQAVERASQFVQQTGDRLVAVVNSGGGAPEKRRALTQIIDGSVDVDGVARFCLGRFWTGASADQQRRYTLVFHEVMVTNITSKLGEYSGVRLTVQRGRQQEDNAIVSTVVERPNNPPTVVEWWIGQPSAAPKIIDVVAEGTSLRLTQRQDYAAFLSRNANNIDALIGAMQQQTARAG